MNSAYLVDIVRTPVGAFGGSLSTVRPDDLAAHVIKELIKRNSTLDTSLIEDVIFGAANQAGEDNRNVARMASLLAGLPLGLGGITVNRLCASGLQSMMDAGKGIMVGEGNAYLAGGVESMTRAPFVMGKSPTAWNRQPKIYDTSIGWRFTNKALAKDYFTGGMGETAENVAKKWGVSREAQDEFAFNSQTKYQAAHEAGKFNDEIVAVSIPQRKKDPIMFGKDEHPRLTPLEKLGTLRPAFVKEGGSVTAGNSSGINDGAAVSLIVDEATLKANNLTPKVRIVSSAIAGLDPAFMGMGPVPATQKALKRAGLTVNDLDLIELNEAFAAQSIPCMQDLNLDPEKINVNGGSIAIGHPLGASGTRISATLIHEMMRRDKVKYGLATMCIGVGQGAAIIFEKC